MAKRGRLIVVSGFSGAGKSTVVVQLCKTYGYTLSISATTRAPRVGEQDGREYFFVTQEEFDKRIAEGGFLEYARFVGHSYGTPRDFVEQKLNEGRDVILEIDQQGAFQVKEKMPEALLVFVLPPSMKELKERLVNRKTDSPEVINERLLRAKEELPGARLYDKLLINRTVDTSVYLLDRIIQEGLGQGPADNHWLDDLEKEEF